MIYDLSFVRSFFITFLFFCQKSLPNLPYTLFRFILEFRAILEEDAHQSRHANFGMFDALFLFHMNASQCRDPTARNRALGMRDVHFLHAQIEGRGSNFLFSFFHS